MPTEYEFESVTSLSSSRQKSPVPPPLASGSAPLKQKSCDPLGIVSLMIVIDPCVFVNVQVMSSPASRSIVTLGSATTLPLSESPAQLMLDSPQFAGTVSEHE